MESAQSPLKLRKGTKLLATTEHKIVALTEFKGTIILATERGVYRLRKNKFEPIPFTDEALNAKAE